MNTTTKKVSVALVAGIATLSLGVGAAFAHEGDVNAKALEQHFAHPVAPKQEVSIAANGKIEMKGAKVESVSGNTITVSTSWGALSLKWAVVMGGDTNIIRNAKGARATIADVKAGDSITLLGVIDATASSPTIKATRVQVLAPQISEDKIFSKTVFEGRIKSVAAATVPTTMVVTVGGDKDITVKVPVGISILNKQSQLVPVASIVVGHRVQIGGTVEATSTITATVVQDKDL